MIYNTTVNEKASNCCTVCTVLFVTAFLIVIGALLVHIFIFVVA